MVQHTAVQSAETLAALRAIVANEADLAVKCEDRHAKHFLGAKYQMLTRIVSQCALKQAVNLVAPGSYCFAIVRTRHFDEVLLGAIRAGVRQVVILGAGYDSRALRFQEELEGIRVYEIDHPGTQARKRRSMANAGVVDPPGLTYIPIDFNRQSFQAALSNHGFSTEVKTLFLWEGVSYYLPRPVVEEVLDFVGGCAPGSSIVFDYALKGFVDGDTSTYGGKQVAKWLRRIGEPFLFGLDAHETASFLAARNLEMISDLGPDDLERAYLQTRSGERLGKTLGHVRIAFAKSGHS